MKPMVCVDCGESDISKLCKDNRNIIGRRRLCKSCNAKRIKKYNENKPEKRKATLRKYREKNKEKINKANREYTSQEHVKLKRLGKIHKDKYGLTSWDFLQMFKEQNGKCKICGTEKFYSHEGKANIPVVDHCHKTGNVRGLLCNNCNRGIGLLKDDKDIVFKAYNYLANTERMKYE
jgi:hypothetical protein